MVQFLNQKSADIIPKNQGQANRGDQPNKATKNKWRRRKYELEKIQDNHDGRKQGIPKNQASFKTLLG
jgi:hypothetical protein